MKKILFIGAISTMFFMFACQKEDNQSSSDNYLYVERLGYGAVNYLEPELLQVIKNQMIEQNRAYDTIRLFNTYNKKTGEILINYNKTKDNKANIFTNMLEIDSSLLNYPDTIINNYKDGELPWDNYYLKYKVHLQGIGWTGNYGKLQFAGTRGQNRRMEAFIISHDEMMIPMEYPDIRYQANVSGLGWLWEQQWNGVAGTTGQSRTMVQLKIRSATPGYTTKYMIHQQHVGDQGWFYNGEVAGVYPYKRIEGFALDIYKW